MPSMGCEVSLEEGLQKVEKRFRYLYDKFHPSKWTWIACYSGGKDSTALLLSLAEFSNKKNFTPIIVHENTTVEIPLVETLVKNSLEYFMKQGFQVKVLTPPKGFFNIMLERGYGFPTWNRRWCCRILKYGLAKQWVKSSKIKALNLIGIRGDEGRRATNFVKKYNGIVSAFPLIDVTESWVWSFLKERCSWFEELKKMYPHRSNRLGCWVCTVVSEDHALKNLDPQLYGMKIKLVRVRCLNIELFVKLLDCFSKLRPDAFKGYDPKALFIKKEPSCKGKYCGICRMRVWRFKGSCGFD